MNLLVGVVRTLTTSESSDQRELEKRRLEHGYAETSRKVETLVAGATHILNNLENLFD